MGRTRTEQGALLRQLLLLLVTLFSVSAAALRGGCRCPSLHLLQGAEDVVATEARPRDCTCVNGMKTYATTPRDTLQGLTEAALHHHLEKCERERGELEGQTVYKADANEAQVRMVQSALARRAKQLEAQQNHTAKKQSTLSSEKEQLQSENRAMELELPRLKGNSSAQFTVWYRMNSEMSVKLAKLTQCTQCHSVSKANALLVARQTIVLAPKDRYDIIFKVEECENGNIKLADKLAAGQAATNRATVAATDGLDKVNRQTADHTRLSRIMSKKPQVEALKRVQKSLEGAVESEQRHLDGYKKKNADLRAQLDELNANLEKCGC